MKPQVYKSLTPLVNRFIQERVYKSSIFLVVIGRKVSPSTLLRRINKYADVFILCFPDKKNEAVQ